MNAKIKSNIHAIFKCRVFKDSTKELVKETGEFENLVLDSGLKRMNEGAWFDCVRVGSGNSEPNVSQLTLDKHVATTNKYMSSDSTTNRATRPWYLGLSVTLRFSTGQAVGNLTEIGIGWGTGAPYPCWNRTLIKDVNGDPTVLTILPDEYLDVTVEVRVYPAPTVEGSFKFVDKLGATISEHTYIGHPILGASSYTNHQWTMYRARRCTNVSAGFKDDGTSINGSVIGDMATSNVTFSLISTGKASGYAVYPLNSANGSSDGLEVYLSGCLSNANSYGFGYKFKITPPIVKNNEMQIDYNVQIEWGRYSGG